MTIAVLVVYMAVVLSIGVFSHRLLRRTGEDYFLASRGIGPFVLLMSLFGTHMTAFALLGSSGEAYHAGVGVFPLMASASALVVPAAFFFVGTRAWSVGKRFGYITQVELFRDRWQSDRLGLLLFVVLVSLVIPYLLIGVMGGGITLSQITQGQIPEWAGSLVIVVVVMIYVTYGGLRGTAWVNTFQTLVFMTLGAATFFIIVQRLGGLETAMTRVAAQHPDLLVRSEHLSPLKMLTYSLIPLSAGMFPHLFMHWLSAKRASNFKLTVVAYPLFVAAVWIPPVLLGMFGNLDFPGLTGPESNSILVRMIDLHAPGLLAGLLGAGVFAAVMSSLDSQVLALGTMFTEDIVKHYGYHDRMSDRQQVLVGRLFVAGILAVTYLLSLGVNRSIFDLATWSFTGFAALFPVAVAALFWRRATKAGVYASVLGVVVLWLLFFNLAAGDRTYTVGGTGIMPVAVILIASVLALVVVSLMTSPPNAAHVAKFVGRPHADSAREP